MKHITRLPLLCLFCLAGASLGSSASTTNEGEAKSAAATPGVNAGFITEFADDFGSLTNSPFFDSFGNVGLWTTTPSATLDVNGSIAANSGMVGRFFGPAGIGMWGESFGSSAGSDGVHGVAHGPASGVAGVNDSSSGVGVWGQNTSGGGTGVYGITGSGTGVSGTGYNGVSGVSPVSNGNGVVGTADVGGAAYGVWGLSSSGYAGFFTGRVNVTGRFDSPDKHFKIDHPLDPANKYMVHASVESSERMNIYNGMTTLDESGEATVTLPEWFEALNRDFRYQLTSVGAFAPIYIAEKIKDHRFKIAGGQPGMEVSWQVAGVRHDAYANANPMQVEEVKSDLERGFYLHPTLFGQPEEKGLEWAHDPQLMRQLKSAPQK